MTASPNFTALQYLNNATLNSAFGTVSGNISTGNSLAFKAGLIFPEALSYTYSGLNITVSCPAPFGVMFSNGVISQAHGTSTNQDTQSYTVSFSGSVPASGSVTAYLLASYATIQQQPFEVTGPPPGNPDYSSNNQPSTAYAVNIDSMALTASTGAPNNATTFEIGRFTLSAGVTAVPAINILAQERMSSQNSSQVIGITGATNLAYSQAGTTILANTSGVITLPSVSGANGLEYTVAAVYSQPATVSANGSDLIYGTLQNPTIGEPSIIVPAANTISFKAIYGNWYVVGSNKNSRTLLTGALNVFVSTTGNDVTNTGLSITSPFQTVQRAYNFVQQTFDMGGNQCICNLADGTYTQTTVFGSSLVGQSNPTIDLFPVTNPVPASVPPLSAQGAFVLSGNPTNPQNTLFSFLGGGGGGVAIFQVCAGASVVFQNIKMQTALSHPATGGITGILVNPLGIATISNGVIFGEFGVNGIQCLGIGGTFYFTGNYTISGGGYSHLQLNGGGGFCYFSPVTLTIAFGAIGLASYFWNVASCSTIYSYNLQFANGNPMGVSLSIYNAIINTAGKKNIPGGVVFQQGGLYI